MAVNWVHVANAESNSSDDITIPNTASAGDVAFLFDTAASFGGAPSKVVPAGFEEIVSFAGTTIARTTISVKVLEAGDPGSVITGQSGDALEIKNMVVVSSDGDPIGAIEVKSLNSEATTGNPAQQTVTGSDEFVAGGPPIVTFANYAAGNAITSDSFSPARDGELDNAGTDQITAWRFDNLDAFGDPTAQDTTVDMGDEGTNTLASFYVVPSSDLSASGSPQADDATAGGAPSEYSNEIVATPSANQDGVLYQRDDGTEDNRVRFARVAGDLHVIVTTGGVEQADLNLGALTDFTEFTVRAAFADNDIAASLNGAAVVTDNTVTLPDPALLSHRRHGADSTGTSWNAWIRDNREYPSRVPNAELEAGISASGVAFIADGALTDYTTLTRNSTATYWDASSELQTAAIDTARVDHDPADGTLRGFLSEEGRTNLFSRPEELDHADWHKVRSTVTANADVAPDGTTTMDRVLIDSGEGSGVVTQDIPYTSGQSYEGSFFSRNVGSDVVQFVISARLSVSFNYSDGSTSTDAELQGYTVDDAVMTDLGGGLFWCRLLMTAGLTESGETLLRPVVKSGTSDGTQGASIWGAVIGVGDTFTSYAPATREADNATSTVPALAFAKIQASGLPQADDATTSGEIGLLGKASGGGQADDATADGSITRPTVPASGSPQADDATATGAAETIHRASGSPQAEDATGDGSADVLATASGGPQAEDATGGGSLNVFEKFLVEQDRRILTVVEIDYDFCQLTYGTSPCAAVLGTTGDAKCFNTRATCQDPDNYDRGTKVLRFVKPCGYEPIDLDAIPSVAGVSTAAARLRPGQDLGERASVSVSFVDHRYHDRGIDKYARERVSGAALDSGVGYDPNQRGTFWGKFRARYPFFRNRGLRIYQGTIAEYAAGGLAALETRHYIMDTISGPGTGGNFTITAKDVLKLADEDKAQAPRASKGELSADITDSATSFTLNPAGIGDDEYPASGYVTVGNEVMSFTRSGDDMTVVRGEYGTDAEEHSDGDTVQLAIEYDSQRVSAIVEDLLVNYAGVNASFVDSTAWQAEDDDYINRLFGALIVEPEGVNSLIGQLCRQVGFTIWWDEVNQQIRFKAIRQPSAPPLTLTDDANFREATPMVKEQPKKRISQVWVYYGVIDPTESVDEARNYRSVYVGVDANAESDDEYGQPQIKKIFARWIDRFNQPGAQDVANRMLSRYRDAPRKFDFEMAWDQENVRLGDAYDVRTRLMQQADGADDSRRILVTSYERGEDRVAVESEEFLYTPDPDDDVHRVVIDADTTEMADGSPFNLRDAHDDIYTSVNGDDTVELIVEANAILGSNRPEPGFLSSSFIACDIGSWPEGPTIKVIVRGRIQGHGGKGSVVTGQDGGTALYTRYPIELINEGEVWGGGGGGGGGGSSGGENDSGAGGGGAGYLPGLGGVTVVRTGDDGEDGTTEAGGAGGAGDGGGDGGDGGDPGQDGQDGENDDNNGHPGGSAGAAIDGATFVTYTTTGDIRGPQIN